MVEVCTHAGGNDLTEEQRETNFYGLFIGSCQEFREAWGSCSGSLGMPLTPVFGFLLSLASFILFESNIYNPTQAQPG